MVASQENLNHFHFSRELFIGNYLENFQNVWQIMIHHFNMLSKFKSPDIISFPTAENITHPQDQSLILTLRPS